MLTMEKAPLLALRDLLGRWTHTGEEEDFSLIVEMETPKLRKPEVLEVNS